jgi:antitoxin PrlF
MPISEGDDVPDAVLSSKGQITIPLEVRRALRLETGARVQFIPTDNGTFEIRSRSSSIAALKGTVPRTGPAVSIEEMDEAIAAVIADQ